MFSSFPLTDCIFLNGQFVTKLFLCPLSGVTSDDFLESIVIEVNVEVSSWVPTVLEVNYEGSSWVPLITLISFNMASLFNPMSALASESVILVVVKFSFGSWY